MKNDTSPCIWPAFVLLFGDISDERDKATKAHMSRQPVRLPFSTKLTSGKRLGWAGLQLLQLFWVLYYENSAVGQLKR